MHLLCCNWTCLHVHRYCGFESHPDFDHILDMTFTWNADYSSPGL